MRRWLCMVVLVAAVIAASPVFAQDGEPEPAGVFYANGGVHSYLRAPLTGALAENEALANLRGELGVGFLGRDDSSFEPFVYGLDFRFLLSFADLTDTSVAFTDVPLRGAFGAKFGDLYAAAFAGPGLYSSIVTAGGDAVRLSLGLEAGVKAIFAWGLYAEASFVAPEVLLMQDSSYLTAQPAGLRVGIGWNFLSASADDIATMQAEAEAAEE